MSVLRNKFINLSNLQDIGKEVESNVFVRKRLDNEQLYIPSVNYSNPEEFARFGLAEQYYEDSIKRIYRTYPYDGSRAELEEWLGGSTSLDKWMFENLYPRTNGYATIGNAWGTQQFILNGYGAPASSSYEYIQTKGGPNLGFDLAGDRKTLKIRDRFENANKYDPTKKRASNLEFNITGVYEESDNGVTVEFWLKKEAFDSSLTNKEVIFDLWNNKSYTEHDYGRLRIELNSTASASSFRVTCLSGTSGFSNVELGVGSSVAVSGIADGNWKHYAFSFHMNSDDQLEANMYLNGRLNDTKTLSATINQVTGALVSNIGSLLTQPENVSGSVLGHGKLLSSSLDEFRFWKVRRTEEEISKFYNDRVGGGVNTDENTTDLGVYYKFNEGVTLTSSIDSLVLDYSGRVSNGVWVGYSQALNPRNTGSAIVQASASNAEFKDPIIYSFHPEVSTLITNIKASGSEHDYKNQASLYNSYPSWIIDEDQSVGTSELKKMSQVMASVLDNIYIQIEYLTKYKNIKYKSDQNKQIPFINKMLRGLDFVAPSILSDATVNEYFLNKNSEVDFEKSILEIKNTIYQNIYNNLSFINQSKGTEESYRNILRCLGVDDSVIKMNLYADNQAYEFRDNYANSSKPVSYVNFHSGNLFDASVYQMTSSGNSDTKSLISASSIPEQNDFIPFALESEVIFPETFRPSHRKYLYTPFISASLFGFHNALGTDESDLTWQLPETSSLQVYAVKDRIESNDAKFVLSGTIAGEFPVLSSSFFPDVYNDDKWNFSLNIRHEKYPLSDEVGVTSLPSEGVYIVEFYGVNTILDTVPQNKEFLLTASLTNAQGRALLRSDKRVYIGAHKENFTGSTLTRTDTQISNVRAWLNYLPTSSVLAHAKYQGNKGIGGVLDNLGYLNTRVKNQDIPNIDTLIFEWNFSTNSGTNDLGEFEVLDETSGSLLDSQEKYDQIGRIKFSFPGKGTSFTSSSTSAFGNKYLATTVQKLPEIVNSSDMIEIRDTNIEAKTKASRPSNHILTFEKSMYQSISEDMIRWFETISELNNIIGHPVQKYRYSYKTLDILRDLYFSKVQNEPDLERFLTFYKWFDGSILEMLRQMTPASVRLSEVWDVVESHVLERNKYVHKFPLLETKVATSGNLKVENYDWKNGHAPSSLNEEENGLWWDQRAALDDTIWSDLPSDAVSNRKSISLAKDEEFQRENKNPISYDLEKIQVINGGVNFEDNRKIEPIRDYIKPLAGRSLFGGVLSDNFLTITITEKLRSLYNTDLPDALQYPAKNKNYKFNLNGLLADSTGESIISSSYKQAFFSLVSSSVKTGYNRVVTTALSNSVQLSNLHHDMYDSSTPIQGPFTDTHVGGQAYRHVEVNVGNDNRSNRPEAWQIEYNGSLLAQPSDNVFAGERDPYTLWSRGELVKRPLNVVNIRSTTSSNRLGNYCQDYEVVNTTGRKENNLYIRENNGINLTNNAGIIVTGMMDYIMPQRDVSSSKSIIATKFSAPGGVETSHGHLDVEAGEYSAYNALPWRNLVIRSVVNQLYATASNQFGVDDPSNPLSASYHKTNRNIFYRMEKDGSSVVTGTLYDNGFVQHLIPRNEEGYKWVRDASVSAPFGYSQPDSKDGVARDVVYVSASNFGSYYDELNQRRVYGIGKNLLGMPGIRDFFPVDFIGMNLNFYEPITGSENKLGYESIAAVYNGQEFNAFVNYINSDIVNGDFQGNVNNFSSLPGLPSILNGLLLKRNGPWGFSSWKQIRVGEHPINRYQKKNNIISIVANPIEIYDGFRTVLPKKPYQIEHFVESVVDGRYQNMTHLLEYNDQNILIEHSYGNKLNKFANKELNEKSNQRFFDQTQYEKIKTLYLQGEENINAKLKEITYSEIVYPSNKFSDLSKTKKRLSYTETVGYGENGFDRRIDQRNTFWPPSIERTSIDGTTPFKNAVDYRYGRSVYPFGNSKVWYVEVLDNALYDTAVEKILTGTQDGELSPPVYVNPVGGAAYCDVNVQGMFGSGSAFISGSIVAEKIDSTYFDHPTASLQYVYMPFIGKRTEYNWPYDVYKQSGKQPWYHSYEEYSKDVKIVGQGHTLIPEFRISDHISYYVDQNKGFFGKNNKFLSLQGVPLSSSTSGSQTSSLVDEFFETYTNASAFRHLNKVLQDHNNLNLEAKRLTLKCSGVKKLLPYNGFYPINRTTQLGALFSQSLGPHISGTFYDSPESSSLALQSLLQPFFAPGILFNTVKSGIAVDWPIITGSSDRNEVNTLYGEIKGDPSGVAYDAFSLYISSSGPEADFNGGLNDWREYNLTSAFDNFGGFSGKYHSRVPFETLVDLRKGLLSGTNIYLTAPDKILQPSGSARTRYPYFNWNGEKSPLFQMAMHNFLSEVPKFFLEDEKLTVFSSVPEKAFKAMEKDKTYYMDVVLKKTEDMYMMKSYFSGTTPSGSSENLGVYDTPMTYDGRYFGPPAQKGEVPSYLSGNLIDTRAISYSDPAYAPYTPPYFYGEARARLAFTPQESRKYSLDEILSNVRASSSMILPSALIDENTYFAQNNAMCVDASVNLYQKGNTLENAESSGFDTWLISSKFETPVLNFGSSEASEDVANKIEGHATEVFESYLGRGMWGTYGSIPTGSTGIYLEVRESFPEVVGNSTSATGSLIDICGFQQQQKRIGKIAEKKQIQEAIVAIPYLERNVECGVNIAGRNFVRINKEKYKKIKENINLEAESSISNMIKAMDKYYFPPFMDFSNPKSNVDPFITYIFEFDEELDKDDLSDIWQGVMPKPAMRTTKQEVVLSHPISDNEFFDGIAIPSDLKWLVFKVKRKAGKNYYDLIPGSEEVGEFVDEVIKQTEDYNYNWPYDYFSLVELAKIEAKITLENDYE